MNKLVFSTVGNKLLTKGANKSAENMEKGAN